MQKLERFEPEFTTEYIEELTTKTMKIFNLPRDGAKRQIKESIKGEHWRNDIYHVVVRRGDHIIHLSIKRHDREPVVDWRDKQAIKNQLCGPECEGVEMFPAESRVIDTSNQFHLWVFKDPKVRLPFGFDEGKVKTDVKVGHSKQRAFTGVE